MNILIPHQWLLDHLDTKATPKQIQKYLSLCGPSVERIYQIEGDSVYDIEITTNRVDSMSVRGVAREAAVILNQFGIEAKLKPLKILTEQQLQPTKELPLPKVMDNSNLCKRKIGLVLENINRTATPDWMAQRLRQVEINVHESIIDITNYVTHDLGHPCHAFDYDKLMTTGGEIIVTEAAAGKKFISLDGEEYTATGGEIVFENRLGEIIDLPAIKGTANTSVDNNTKNVLLWIENLPAKKVRVASMSHAIRTVAAQLSEKNADPHLAKEVLLKGVELYQQLCNAQISSKLYDDFSQPRKSKIIKLHSAKVIDYLGIDLEKNKIINILKNLGCKIEDQSNDQSYLLLVTPPTFRPDLIIPVDLVEEIARIYGYHNLPSKIMDTRIPLNKPLDLNFHLEEKIKSLLANLGWQEVYTYSMVSEELAKKSGYKVEAHLKLQNPLTEDRVYLRRSLIPSLVEVLENNPLEKNLGVFEFANVYYPQTNKLPNEEMKLALVSNESYRRIKGNLETIFESLFLDKKDLSYQQEDNNAVIDYKKIILGQIIYDARRKITSIQIDWINLLKNAKYHPTYKPLAKTAFIIEDLTFAFTEKTKLDKMFKAINGVDQKISQVSLKDSYKNRYTIQIYYHDQRKNITKDDIESVRKSVVKLVSEEYQGQLVGELSI